MKPEVRADGGIDQVALPIKFYTDTWTLPFEARRVNIRARPKVRAVPASRGMG